jgi:hypothetical protein
MTRRTARLWLWTIPLLPLTASPAAASSITCYGSIVITSFGTNGLKIDYSDDKAGGQPTVDGGSAATTGADAGGAVGSGSAGGTTPLQTAGAGSVGGSAGSGSGGATATPAKSGGGGSGAGSGATGNPNPTVTETPSGDVITGVIEVPKPPATEQPPAPPVDLGTGTTTTPPPGTETTGGDVTPVVAPVGPPIEVTTGTPQAENTPEPASVTLLALAGLGGWAYKRRRTQG